MIEPIAKNSVEDSMPPTGQRVVMEDEEGRRRVSVWNGYGWHPGYATKAAFWWPIPPSDVFRQTLTKIGDAKRQLSNQTLELWRAGWCPDLCSVDENPHEQYGDTVLHRHHPLGADDGYADADVRLGPRGKYTGWTSDGLVVVVWLRGDSPETITLREAAEKCDVVVIRGPTGEDVYSAI
jgi:hypothetical protein